MKHTHTYVDINGIILDKVTYYVVTFTKVYEMSLFGKVIKEIKKIQEVPFVFKSYEIAKEFCELNPLYKQYTFSQSSRYDTYRTTYETYKLVLNNKVNVYIIWDHLNGTYNFAQAEFHTDDSYPIVKGFIKDELNNIKLPITYSAISAGTWPQAPNMVEKLSDIFAISENDKHHFELIEQ